MDLELRAVNYNLEVMGSRILGIEKKLHAVEENTREGIKKMTWFKQRQHPVDVYVRISVVTVGDIDTVKQQFVCEFYLSLRWEEPMLKDMIGREEEIDWRDYWEPGMYFVDLVDVEKYERNETLCPPRTEGGNPEVMFYYLIRGTFKEVLDITYFPFDYQTLSLTLTTSWKWELVSLHNDPERDDNIRTWNFTGRNEWDLQPHVLTESTYTQKEPAASNNVFPVYKVKMHARRKYGYYVYNVALIMDLITALTFTAYTVDASMPAERIQISLTLLLTSIALKYVVNTFVPQVPYPTVLDKFIITCMMFQFFMAVQNAISALLHVSKPAVLSLFEWLSFAVLLLAFSLIHIVFGCYWFVYTKSARHLIRKHEREYQKLRDAVKEISAHYNQLIVPQSANPLSASRQNSVYSFDSDNSGRHRPRVRSHWKKAKLKWKRLVKRDPTRSGLANRI
eukprot:gene20422-22435_t